MSYSKFHPRKNDFAFAFLMAVVFAFIVGAVAGTVNLISARMAVDAAKAQGTSLAMRGPSDQADRVVPSGARE